MTTTPGGRARRPAAWAALLACALPHAASAQVLSLREALDSAFSRHPSLVRARARADAADEALAMARATRLPGVGATASLTRFAEPMVVAPLHGFDPTNPPDFDETLVQGQLAVQQTLFDGGARAARIRGASALAEVATVERGDAEAELIERVTTAYLGVLSARAVARAAERQLAAFDAEEVRARRHVEAGSAAELESLRARAALQDARAQAATARSRVGLAERSLARATGVVTVQGEATALADVALAANAGAAADSLPARVSRHVAVRTAERALAAAEARLSQERATRLPTLDATAGVLDFGSAGGDHVLEWQAGLRVSWPLFTGGARSAAVRRAEAEARAARAALDGATLRASHEVDAAESARVEADALADALRVSVERWEEVARVEALALEAGSGEQRDLLRAEAALFQARAGQASARYEAVLARVRLARALGDLDRAWIERALETAR